MCRTSTLIIRGEIAENVEIYDLDLDRRFFVLGDLDLDLDLDLVPNLRFFVLDDLDLDLGAKKLYGLDLRVELYLDLDFDLDQNLRFFVPGDVGDGDADLTEP